MTPLLRKLREVVGSYLKERSTLRGSVVAALVVTPVLTVNHLTGPELAVAVVAAMYSFGNLLPDAVRIKLAIMLLKMSEAIGGKLS